MVYILNKNINPKKKLLVALVEIFGLGKYQSIQICNALGLSYTKYVKQLNPSEVEQLIQIITQNYEIGHDVRRIVSKNVQRLVDIGAYRGFRHREGLPVRGQRTHGNSRTAKKIQYTVFTKTSE
jgi:small subunit ribosomal protein S13